MLEKDFKDISRNCKEIIFDLDNYVNTLQADLCNAAKDIEELKKKVDDL